ncbi:SVOP, partial [Cervus elaphus hippelaphus]
VVKFRRTGESARSEDDAASGEHEVQIEGVRAGLEAVELDDGAAVPKEFANPTDDTFMVEDAVEAIGFGKFQWKLSVLTGLAWASGLCRHDVQLYPLGKHLRPHGTLAQYQEGWMRL